MNVAVLGTRTANDWATAGMQRPGACVVLAAALAALSSLGSSLAARQGHLSCDCRLWHLRDTSIALHCTRGQNGTSQISCQKEKVLDIPQGYHYVPGYALIKLSRVFMPWAAAKKACEDEGAQLAVPTDRRAFDGLKKIFQKVKGVWYANIGITDQAKEGEFVDIYGRPVSNLPWLPNDPNNAYGNENCVDFSRDGFTNDVPCEKPAPFFCERRLSVAAPEGYEWLDGAGRLYRVHVERAARADAARTCRFENATLAVTDTWRRAEAVLGLLEPKQEVYLVGFTDEAVEGDFVTETGRHLADMEFQVWDVGEPQNNDRAVSENCLALSDRGFYKDVRCDLELPFICEIAPVSAGANAVPPTSACRSPPPNDAAVSRLRNLSVEERGRRLIEAAKNGAMPELQALLAAGADVGAKDEKSNTALHWAAWEGYTQAVRCLMEAGAHKDIGNSVKNTPLHWAAWGGRAAVVRLLLASSANPNVRNQDGMTPLHEAAKHGRADVAIVLLDAGADKEARTNEGYTPLEIARQYNQHHLVDLLR
ncbi:uncharacterized protein LOC126284640 [Schistocerca gregaria]|uniref:uncharacterized protein LOC126284640 n=1 Tax=Schistocerca gregaria TaxID=7010 RepID=UPI00211E46BF|nr:uncharacterized protein LOC126284640 [Schistocerca gregaria]